ncbi:CCA tRNA nucleotidyltransferase [bacterium]|nr:CCA tRNA nucleotidyltransferase [bacterium]
MDKYIKTIENDEVIKLIKPFLKGIEAYLVGGFIRDIFMDKKSTDRDIVLCKADVKEFSKSFADKIKGHFIELDNINNIYRVVLPDKINYVDIALALDNDINIDIKRRDLTINAIAYDINTSNFIDLTGGIEDIKNKKIKGIEEKNFQDDALRLLRIFRFYSKTGFEIDKELVAIATKMHKEINKPAKERITVELLKMFEGKFCSQALIKLDECGLLEEIFPILKEVKKVPKNTHHHLDLFHHSLETVSQMQKIYENANKEVKEYLENYRYGGVQELAFLKLSGFLHDIGKPSTWTIEEETQRHRFIKHDEEGSKLVEPILKQLKFSKKQIDYVKTLIKYHMYASALVSSPDASEKAFMKFYRKMDGYVIDLIIIAMADRLSARGEAVTQETVDENINALTNLLNNYLQLKKNIKPLPKLLDGIDIMELLKIKQSPKLGEIINALKEAQLSGEVNTKQDAVDFVLKTFS